MPNLMETEKSMNHLKLKQNNLLNYGKEELNRNDFVIRDMLMKSGKKIILAVNKIDNQKRMNDIYSFYELGFDNIIPISGEHNIGISNLLDEYFINLQILSIISIGISVFFYGICIIFIKKRKKIKKCEKNYKKFLTI